ncbi:GPI ethanolamine phosphate transferase 2 [Fusarium falciforme]|uniref:GPI ethanolamine phosphate transferase 2 n=1 Tax=Fusarium falciforme TaxID=195108 RepID=UPI002300A727|nr:GPI ethanolamine phosphate transferase 2 [Fusarium falciforme]WAO91006.1 GPI ethanolamine phosphate transferase 2 [Fusarium falciforme]
MVSSSNGSLLRSLLLVVANLLIPVSILVFAMGFFPYKPFLPGLAEFEPLDIGSPPDAPFNRLIFMVVDALRSDFVYSDVSGFQYVQSLIRDGSAMPFTANARSPTVTMPRIKSMTTGSIPSFVDLILNFDEADTSSTLASQDTWVAQIKAREMGKALMYGDDTWLKLFPNTFDREDGTTSFFVADFTEVDNNVTRNIAGELENNDWGLMVLHYLGLDHIGHKAGPRSSNMIPKQREMDGIVQTLFEAMQSKPHLDSTLLVLCGDHGMNDAGNHGASSPGETSPALVFLSPKLKTISSKLPAPAQPKDEFDYYSMVEQSDIAPTIAALLGFPVSKNNLGAFIPDFLPFWPKTSDKIQILVRNARQILNIVTAAFGAELFDAESNSDPCSLEKTEINELACQWRKINKEAHVLAAGNKVDQEWLDAMSEWLRRAQELMSSMASNYEMPKLYIGQAIAAVSAIASGLVVFKLGAHRQGPLLPYALLTLSYGTMMFASSYVEEEQHFWYWTSSIWLLLLGVRHIRRLNSLEDIGWLFISLAALRITRAWNQTGQKFAGSPDIVKSFIVTHPQLLWSLLIFSYMILSFRMLARLKSLPSMTSTALTSVLLMSAFSFKLDFTSEDAPELVVGFARSLNELFQGQSLLWRARTVFTILAIFSAYGTYRSFTGGRNGQLQSAHLFHHLLTLLGMTQSRATNIPLFLLSDVLFHSLQAVDMSVPEIATTTILLQYATFFAFGGSNAISSVDLSSAYNGISGFNVVAVGVLTFVSNWAGPLFWSSAANLLLLRKYHEGRRDAFVQYISLQTLFVAVSVAFVMAACTALRTHLFIWTVFSPKYLYCMAWSLGQHLLVNIAFGGQLFWHGSRG